MTALVRSGRTVGISVLAGFLAGIIVGGIGGRLVMRLIAVLIGPAFVGRVTDNGNVVGEITLGGTIGLIVFGGVVQGLVGGFLYAAVRPWLAQLGRWRAPGFGILLLVVFGSTVITPENPDFRRFGSPIVNVALFAVIYVGFGALLASLVTVLERALPAEPGSRGTGIGRIALAVVVTVILLLGLFLLTTLVITTARTLIGAADPGTGFGVANSLVVLGALGAALLGRVLREPIARRIVLAIPTIGGAWLTATSIARIFGLA